MTTYPDWIEKLQRKTPSTSATRNEAEMVCLQAIEEISEAIHRLKEVEAQLRGLLAKLREVA